MYLPSLNSEFPRMRELDCTEGTQCDQFRRSQSTQKYVAPCSLDKRPRHDRIVVLRLWGTLTRSTSTSQRALRNLPSIDLRFRSQLHASLRCTLCIPWGFSAV